MRPRGPLISTGAHGLAVLAVGIAYNALNELAYGYIWLAFPHRHLKNRTWIFLDASAGKMIIGAVSRNQEAIRFRAEEMAMIARSSDSHAGTALALIAAAGSLTAVLSACSSPAPARNIGVVSGVAAPCVGITKPGLSSVTVSAKRNGRIVESRRLSFTRAQGNPYRFVLSPATYVIDAPESGLPARNVSVQPGSRITVNFRPSCK